MSSEARHQASTVLAAFRYQLMQSLAAWLDLAPDETLWLEVSEDFSVAASEGATDIQVKSSAKPLGLRSKDVTDALERFWQRANTEVGHGARLVFISRGSAAREHGFSFPENMPGLLYWRAAAQGADTGPIRQFLSQLFSGKPLGNWLDTEPSDEELRSRLLRPILWTLEAADAERLTDDIEDRVAALLLSKGLPVSASNVGSKVLLDHVFETASREGSRPPQTDKP